MSWLHSAELDPIQFKVYHKGSKKVIYNRVNKYNYILIHIYIYIYIYIYNIYYYNYSYS